MTTSITPTRDLSTIDILEQTATIIRFLADIAPLLHDQGGNIGLSESGACGLYYIMDDLHNRLETAINQM